MGLGAVPLRLSAAAAGASAVVVALIVFRATWYSDGSPGFSLPLWAWALLVAAAVCLAVSVYSTLYCLRLRRQTTSCPAKPSGQSAREEEPSGEGLTAEKAPDVDAGEKSGPAIGLLSGDERRLYDLIVSSGGEMLQMRIVESGAFSKAKVSRLLTKLEGRGMVVRERRGMTNLVRILR